MLLEMKVIWSVEVLPVILKKKAYFPYPFVGKRREFWRAVLFCDILVYLVGSQAFKGVGGTLFKSFFFFFSVVMVLLLGPPCGILSSFDPVDKIGGWLEELALCVCVLFI